MYLAVYLIKKKNWRKSFAFNFNTCGPQNAVSEFKKNETCFPVSAFLKFLKKEEK